MTPPGGRAVRGSRDGSAGAFEHLVSEAGENHVAVVGRHDLCSTHPDVPSHLIEITRVDVDLDGHERTTAETEREAQATLVHQFLAD